MKLGEHSDAGRVDQEKVYTVDEIEWVFALVEKSESFLNLYMMSVGC